MDQVDGPLVEAGLDRPAKKPGSAPKRTRLESVMVWPEWAAGSL
jgi:hypothetical protein